MLPGTPPGTYGQNRPGTAGANLSFAPAAQTRPAPITDPGQPPREGASTPVTPARQFPASPSPNWINVATPEGPSGPSAPQTPWPAQRPAHRLPLLAAAFSLLVIAGIIFGLTFTPFWQHLAGGGPGLTPTPGGNGKTPGPGGSVTVTASRTAIPSLSCPAAGTARAAVMPSFSLGSDANIVYFVNEGTQSAPTFGTLKRDDTLTGQKTEIVKMAKTRIDNALLSRDGQWILFSARVQGQAELGLVRMDGHMLQTLYCAPTGYTITPPQWTEDQKLVAFDATPGTAVAKLYLLNIATGSLSTELAPPASGLSYLPRTWLDYTHILLTGYYPNSASPQQNIYSLDIGKGANQQNSDLQLLATVGTQQNPCWDFDSSIAGNTLYISRCNPTPSGGSSTIQAQQSTGSTPPTTAFSSSTLSINSVRVYDRQNAFLLATTTGALYKIALDGSNNAIQLASVSQGSVGLTAYSQFSWSNVSRDGSMFALENYSSAQGQNITYTLLYGSMSGGSTHTIASINDGTVLEIIGWTTM